MSAADIGFDKKLHTYVVGRGQIYQCDETDESDERPMFSLHTRQADTLLGGRVYGSMDATVLLLLA